MSKGVGVYIGRNEIVAVSAIRSPAGPVIKSYAIEPINPEGSQEPSVGKEAHKIKKMSPEAQAILKALDKIKEPGAFVNVAVTSSQVATRHFIMPAVPKKDEPGAVRHEASRYIPFKLSDSVMDYFAQLTHRNVISVTASAIRGEVLQTCLDDLHSASARVLMVEPAYVSVGRVFGALNVTGRTKTHGFVVLESDGNVNVTMASKGVVYLSREFLLTGKIDEDKTKFCEELKASLDYFYKLTGGEAIDQIFLAGTGDIKGWIEHLEQAFNYSIRFDSAKFPNIKNVPPEDLSVLMVPFGLALRSLGYHSLLGDIKLLPMEERRSGPQQLWTFLGIEILIIVVLFAIIRLAVFQPYLIHLEKRSEAVLAEANLENPDLIAQSVENLKMEKEKLGVRARQLEVFFADKYPVSSFMTALGQGLPRAISLDYISLENTGSKEKALSVKGKKRLNMRGICFLGNAEKETEVVSGWVKALAGKKVIADYFRDIKLVEIRREKVQKRDLTRFRIVAE